MSSKSKGKLKGTEIGMIPEDWEVSKVKDVARINELSITKDFRQEEIEYIDIASVENRQLVNVQLLSISEAPSRAKRIVRNNDILISTVRPNLKHFTFIKKAKPNMIASTGFAVISSFDIDPQYLYYYLTTDEFTDFLARIADAHTSAYPACNPDVIENADVAFPSDTQEQRAIAEVLGSLDDKIVLNVQMNKILEAIGQAIFKHWFIDFEFQNEEGKPYKSSGGKMVDSAVGEIPSGWAVKLFSELIAVNPKRQLAKGSLAKKVSMADLERWQSWITSWSREEYKGGSVFKNEDTLFARITPCLEQGKTAFVSFLDDEEVAFGSTEFIVLSPKVIKSPALIFCLARSTGLRDEAIMSMTGTSGRQRVPNEFFDKYLIACPPDDLVDRFEELVGPMMLLIRENAFEMTSLRVIRDSLLPRLMSGKIRVPVG
jgi:type I restriction enzyme S subunit